MTENHYKELNNALKQLQTAIKAEFEPPLRRINNYMLYLINLCGRSARDE